MTRSRSDEGRRGGSARDVLRLVASGSADNRADLARLTGLSPSTVSQRIEALIARGLLHEAGNGVSRGGRRPRHLEIAKGGGVIGAIDLGAHHARLATLDLSGKVTAVRQTTIEVSDGPEVVLTALLAQLDEISALPVNDGRPIQGLGLGVPGPVEFETGRLVSPSRMPGWNGFDVRSFCTSRLDVPVVVDNDANLMAVGEHRAAHADLDHAVYVKAGTGIGSGVISSGSLYRGAGGSVGDISHCQVIEDPQALCSCGNTGCLEAVASGDALVRALRDRGIEELRDTTDVVRLVQDGDPLATSAIRSAGHALGEILSVVVNFFNPQAIVIGGALAECEPLLASVRGALYERCLPLATKGLLIESSTTGVNAGILGGAQLVIDRLVSEV